MPLKIVYLLVRWVLGLAVLVFRTDLAKDAQLLVFQQENAVLRRHASRVRYKADRVWLAALARLIPRHRWAEVFPVTPATLLAWHRRLAAKKYDTSERRKPGRRAHGPGHVAALPPYAATENAGHHPNRISEPHRMPLYPDLRLTPDGLDRFLQYALADARQPMPERQSMAGEIETIVTYPDGTIGPSLEALEARKRLGLE